MTEVVSSHETTGKARAPRHERWIQAFYGSSLRLDSAQIRCRRGLGARGRELSLDGVPPLSCLLVSTGDAASIVLLRWGDAAAVGTWLRPAGAPTLSLLPRRLIPALASSGLAVAGELPPTSQVTLSPQSPSTTPAPHRCCHLRPLLVVNLGWDF
jgi:hypothetical protein